MSDNLKRGVFRFIILFAVFGSFMISGCGGGAGGGAATATIQGQAVDGPLGNAKISLYSGGLSGSPIATTTADSNGNYSLSFSPSGSAPLFLEAESQGNTLSSYIGNSNSITGTVSSKSDSNLNITQVTTATLAVIQNQGISLSILTPSNYATNLTNFQNVIIQTAAVVQDIIDQNDSGCALSSGKLSLSSLSSALGTNLSSTTNVISNISGSLTSCTTSELNTLAEKIPANQTNAPQLTASAALTASTPSVSAGTYTGTVYPIVTYTTDLTGSCVAPAPPINITVIVDSSGSLTLSYSQGTVNTKITGGTLTGYNFQISGIDGWNALLTVMGTFSPLASGSISGGSAFSINGSFSSTCSTNSALYQEGTFNAPFLTTGGSISKSASSIPAGSYPVYLTSITNLCQNSIDCGYSYGVSGPNYSPDLVGTIVIGYGTSGPTISYDSADGTILITGNIEVNSLGINTFSMTGVNPNTSCKSLEGSNGSLSVTGVVSSSGGGKFSGNGIYQVVNSNGTSNNCMSSGTFSFAPQ